MRKCTRYFENEVRVKRPYLKMEWIEEVLAAPIKVETQEDGRIRYWGKILETGRILRVITLADDTLHNAFPDRTFR